MIDPSKVFTEEQKAAIDTMLAAGFVAFADTKIQDTREFGTGRHTRTFRHRRRYAMVLALKDIPPVIETGAETPVPERPLEEMSKAELLEAAKGYDLGLSSTMNKPEVLAAVKAAKKRRELIHLKF